MGEQQWLLFDQHGHYAGPVIVPFGQTPPLNATTSLLPQPNYGPRWNGAHWVEDAPPPAYDPATHTRDWDGDNGVWRIAPIAAPEQDETTQLLNILLGVTGDE